VCCFDYEHTCAFEQKLPAYERYRHLLDKRELPLPKDYELLEDVFGALETSCSFKINSQQPCVFDHMRKTVENICHRTVNRAQLGQIKTMYPEAYELEAVPFSQRDSKLHSSILIKPTCDFRTTMGANKDNHSPIVARKLEFHSRLLGRVIDHHTVTFSRSGLGSNTQ